MISDKTTKFRPGKLQKLLISPLVLISLFGLPPLLLNLIFLSEQWGIEHTLYLEGIIFFQITYITSRLILFQNRKYYYYNISASSLAIKIYWMLNLISALISIYLFVKIGILGSGDFLYNLRFRYSYEAPTLFGSEYFSLFGLSLSIYYAFNKSNSFMLLSLLPPVLAGIAMGGRGTVLFPVAAVFLVYLSMHRVTIVQFISALVFLLSMLLAMTFNSGKTELLGMFFVIPYVANGISAFREWYLDSSITNCLGKFGGIIGSTLNALSDNKCLDVATNVPDGVFNVFTYLSAPYQFGGESALLISMALLGILYALLVYASQRTVFFKAMLALYSYPLIMIFYDWFFSLTTYIYMIFLLAPLMFKISIVGRKNMQENDK